MRVTPTISGPWNPQQIREYLDNNRYPVRLAINGEDGYPPHAGGPQTDRHTAPDKPEADRASAAKTCCRYRAKANRGSAGEIDADHWCTSRVEAAFAGIELQ